MFYLIFRNKCILKGKVLTNKGDKLNCKVTGLLGGIWLVDVKVILQGQDIPTYLDVRYHPVEKW